MPKVEFKRKLELPSERPLENGVIYFVRSPDNPDQLELYNVTSDGEPKRVAGDSDTLIPARGEDIFNQ